MKILFEGLILSLGFMTRIPLFYKVLTLTPLHYRYLTLSLPFSGLLLSAIMIGVFILLSSLAPTWYIALLVSILYLGLYGFLHLEAVGDIVDALFAKHSGKDAYTILKDPHIGAVGVIALITFILLKLSALNLLLQREAFLALIAILLISRAMLVWVLYLNKFHPNSHFIYQMQSALNTKSIMLFSIMIITLVLLLHAGWLLLASTVTTLLLQQWLKQNIGFLNGDALGFILEINELVLLNIVVLS